MANARTPPTLSMRGQAAASAFMAAFDGKEFSGEELDAANLLLANLNAEMFQILSEIIRSGQSVSKMAAGVLFVAGMQRSPKEAAEYTSAGQKAIKHLVTILSEEGRLAELVCELLVYTGHIPTDLYTPLDRLLTSENFSLRVGAAAALARSDKQVPDAFIVLTDALGSDDFNCRRIAATAFFRNRFRAKKALPVLVNMLCSGAEHQKLILIRGLREIGPSAKLALPTLWKIVNDDKTEATHVRGRAVAAIGAIGKESVEHKAKLSEVLGSEEWQLVGGAAEGLSFFESIPDGVLERIFNLLSHSDVRMRQVAARSFQHFGQKAIVLAPALAERLVTEEDPIVCHAVMDAFGALGTEAFPFLMNLITPADFAKLSLVSLSLLAVGRPVIDSLREFAREYRENESAVATITLLMREMGFRGAPVVPALADILDDAKSPEMACVALDAIRSCHIQAGLATEAIVRSISTWDDPYVEYQATRILRDIGKPAFDALEEAIATNKTPSERLEYAIAVCRPRTDHRFVRLAQANIDHVLQLFVYVAEQMLGPKPLGWRAIATNLRDKIDVKNSRGTPMSINQLNVRKAVEYVNSIYEGTLSTNREGRGGVLTKRGREVLAEIKEYLWTKYGRTFGKK